MFKKMLSIIALLTILITAGQSGGAELQFSELQDQELYDETTAYILNPPAVPSEPEFKHEFVNILILGADYKINTPGKNAKKDIKNCHTDSIIMAALDLTDNVASIISIPRDTLTYVPGAYGVYKLNAALNCAETFEEGVQVAQNTVAWLLGGIRPDHYIVITPHLVEEIGNRIGGLDIDVEMNYTGHSGTEYTKGFQHLDGTGIMDYARSRRNATKNKNDYGRTGRQRVVLNALYNKISEDMELAYEILDVIVENFDSYFYSDLSTADLLGLFPLAERIATGTINGYEMGGELTMAMKYFTSSFFDQQKRKDVIREVYGVEVPAQRLNSHAYLNFLYKYGFDGVKAFRISNQLIAWVKSQKLDEGMLADLENAKKEFVDAISAMDDELERHAMMKVEKKTEALKLAALKVKKAYMYPEKLDWDIVENGKWYKDPYINQYYQIDWR